MGRWKEENQGALSPTETADLFTAKHAKKANFCEHLGNTNPTRKANYFHRHERHGRHEKRWIFRKARLILPQRAPRRRRTDLKKLPV